MAEIFWERIPHSGALVASWVESGYRNSRTFYGYSKRDAARLLAAERRANK